MSRFGRQPAAEILKQRKIKRYVAAMKIGVAHSVLNNTLAGHQAPSQDVRDGLSRLLEMPIEQLFHAEPLARMPGRRYRQGAVLTAGDDPTIRHRPHRRREKSKTDDNGDEQNKEETT